MTDEADVEKGQARREFCAGLREMADFLESAQGIPFKDYIDHSLSFMIYCNEEEIAASAKAGPWEKHYDKDYMSLVRDFGPIQLNVFCSRKDVCTPVKTKSEIVEEPDPDWWREQVALLREQQPKRTVEKTTVLEWDCKPLLGVQTDGS